MVACDRHVRARLWRHWWCHGCCCCYKPWRVVALATLTCSRRNMDAAVMACLASSIADWCIWRSSVRVQQLVWCVVAESLSLAGTHTSNGGVAVTHN